MDAKHHKLIMTIISIYHIFVLILLYSTSNRIDMFLNLEMLSSQEFVRPPPPIKEKIIVINKV